MKVVHFNEDQDNLVNTLNENPDCLWLHYHHRKTLEDNKNIIHMARRHKEVNSNLIYLVNKGYYLYTVRENKISSFVHHSALDKTWGRIQKGELLIDNEIVYSLSEPLLNSEKNNLLVIFSSISSNMYQPFLMRYFEQNFSSIQKYISKNTAVLRIADLGGVTGAYYLNNKFMKNNEDKIQQLIKKITKTNQYEKVTLFGTSKGGSAALYHGLLGDYNFIAVDPIVDDEVYITTLKDLHFVKDTVEISKKVKFAQLINNFNYSASNNGCIICSPRSEQFPYISELLFEKCKNDFSFFVTDNINIYKHPDVAPNSIHMITTLMNCSFNNIKIAKNTYNFI